MQSKPTPPVTTVSTLSSFLGVSTASSSAIFGVRRRLYFSTMRPASRAVELSGQAGPEAIISSLSPTTSERTMEKTFAGAQRSAKRPPLTFDRRLRIVFISSISAPQTSSCFVMSASSAGVTRGDSNRAEPPPESRSNTVSPAASPDTADSAASAAAKEFSSGTGCPASKICRPSIPP